MTEKNSEKTNKNPKKLTKDTAAIIAAVLLIAVYIFYECYVVTHIEVETITAVNSTVYESIETSALVVRDEHIVEGNGSAVTVACVSDGEKVKVGGNIAMTFSSSENAKNYAELDALNSELEYYLEIQSKSAGVATDIESIDKDILTDVNAYIRDTAEYSSGNLSNSARELNDKFTRRQLIIGENVDFSKVTENLQNQINAINSDSCTPTGYVSTDESGVFSAYTDGCENLFDYDNITEIDTETLDNYISMVKTSEKTSVLGKIITNYEWYFCCHVTADQIKNINDGDILHVAIKDSNDVFECEVVSGATVDLGTEESVLILKSSEMNGAITSMRLENIEIRYAEHSGIKVPSSAIHVDNDGNKGIYALVANQAVFRKGEIIYSTKDYAIFEYDSDSSDSIRLYDQIITKGKDLHDGKVYT